MSHVEKNLKEIKQVAFFLLLCIYLSIMSRDIGIILKNRNNITAYIEKTIHKFKTFNAPFIISGFIAVFLENCLTHILA